MGRLKTMVDSRREIKENSPTSIYANLDFGDMENHNAVMMSHNTIQQWVTNVAEATENYLRSKIDYSANLEFFIL